MSSQRVVIVDSNEAAQCPFIADIVRRHFEVEVKHLESGDYVLSPLGNMQGAIGIERKETSDFVRSIMDGRLFSQLRKLCDTYHYPVLLLEGSTSNIFYSPAALNMYVNLTLSWRKLRVAYSRDIKTTAAFIQQCAVYSGPTGREPPPAVDKSQDPEEVRVNMLCAVKGISRRTSRNIWEKMGSWSRIIEAGKEDFMQVEGVGEKLASRLERVFRTSRSQT